MKRIITLFTIAFFAVALTTAQAQMKVNKLGYVNSLELLDAMPEKAPADAELEKYGNDLYASMEKMYLEYQKKVADLQKGAQEKTMNEIEQEMKVKELADMEKRINDFQDLAEEKVAKKRQALYQPIVEKINTAIKDLAKEQGYTYIFDSSAGMLLFAEESDNLLEPLKKKLGIAAAKPATSGK
jgi:outer membrane protein